MDIESSESERTPSMEVNLDSPSQSPPEACSVNTDHGDVDFDCLSFCTEASFDSEFFYMPNFGRNHYICANPQHLPQCRNNSGLTVVIDLDETLITTSRIDVVNNPCYYSVRVRQGTGDFLRKIKLLDIDIVIWSAGLYTHVLRCVEILDPKRELISAAIYRDDSWFCPKPIRKDLRWMTNRDYTKCLLIENNLDAAFDQHDRTVIVPSFYPESPDDNVLESVGQLVETLISGDNRFKPVSQHLPCGNHHMLINNCHPLSLHSLTQVSDSDLSQWFPESGVSCDLLARQGLTVICTPYCMVEC